MKPHREMGVVFERLNQLLAHGAGPERSKARKQKQLLNLP